MTQAAIPETATAPSALTPGYANYVLGVLFLAYVSNAIDRGILNILLEPIRHEFSLSDTELGLLGGLAFAVFYSTVGIALAALADRTSRKNVLAACIAVWSIATAFCGLATSFLTLILGRIGTAAGEAGGAPPSHSLISDYFPLQKRGTALSTYALAIPAGGMLGLFAGGWLNELYGWRITFMAVGIPGILIAILVYFTVKEPPRGFADGVTAPGRAPSVVAAAKFLLGKRSFLHMSFACALHALVFYGAGGFNSSYFMRSHGLGTGEAGTLLAITAGLSGIGTFLGGYLADRLSRRNGDRRWYVWVPGIGCALMVPFQLVSYLGGSLLMVLPAFIVMGILASMFFGPGAAMTQALATVRMRTVASSVLLFIQTLVGLSIGPLAAGFMSDALKPHFGEESLRYSLAIVGFANVWAALHYFLASRRLRQDLEATEALARAG